jgi:hypothetical protein
MHHKSLIVYCCLAAQVLATFPVIRREYYSPYPFDPAGKKMTRLKRTMYAISLLTWIVIGITQCWR